jgi:protein SCO1/2
LEQLGSAAKRVLPVFITVDPARDTTETLRECLAPFDQRIIGLTGNDEQIARSADAFGARYFKVPGADPKEYTMAHSALLYLIGPEGGIVTQFSNGNDPEEMTKTLAALIR